MDATGAAASECGLAEPGRVERVPVAHLLGSSPGASLGSSRALQACPCVRREMARKFRALAKDALVYSERSIDEESRK